MKKKKSVASNFRNVENLETIPVFPEFEYFTENFGNVTVREVNKKRRGVYLLNINGKLQETIFK